MPSSLNDFPTVALQELIAMITGMAAATCGTFSSISFPMETKRTDVVGHRRNCSWTTTWPDEPVFSTTASRLCSTERKANSSPQPSMTTERVRIVRERFRIALRRTIGT